MRGICECCGQKYPEPPEDHIAWMVRDIQGWASENGVPVFGDRLRLDDAAAYLRLKTKTLYNWQSLDPPLPTGKHMGRTCVHVHEFAKYLVVVKGF